MLGRAGKAHACRGASRAGRRVIALALAGSLVAALGAAASADAATFSVTRTDDPPPGLCDADCSLREAVLAANASAGGDTIRLPRGIYRLSVAGTGEDAGATGDLDVLGSVTIVGLRARKTVVDAQQIDRVLDIQSGVVVRVDGVTITGGRVTGGNGGGIQNAATLTLVRTTIRDNEATVAGVNNGGGIDSNGTLTVVQSAVRANVAYNGGGINFGGELRIVNSTLSGNRAGDTSPAGNGDGGAISGSAGATLSLTNVTVTGNRAFNGPGAGGGISAASGSFTNTIVAANVANTVSGGVITSRTTDNCSGAFTSQGHNLEDDDDCNFIATGDLRNTRPRLGSFANNGGPTDTHRLLAGSRAIDAGGASGCPATDQRGVPRLRRRCDIGAYERVFCRRVLVNRVGTSGNDVIVGTSGADGILGRAGRDSISAGGGNDAVCPGPGRDTVRAGGGNDRLALKDRRRDIAFGGAGTDDAIADVGLDRTTSIESVRG